MRSPRAAPRARHLKPRIGLGERWIAGPLRPTASLLRRRNTFAVLRRNRSAVLRRNAFAVLRRNRSAVLRRNAFAVLRRNGSAVLRRDATAVLLRNGARDLSAPLRRNLAAVVTIGGRFRRRRSAARLSGGTTLGALIGALRRRGAARRCRGGGRRGGSGRARGRGLLRRRRLDRGRRGLARRGLGRSPRRHGRRTIDRRGGHRGRADHPGGRGGGVCADHPRRGGRFRLLDHARDGRRLLFADDPGRGGRRGLADNPGAVVELGLRVVVGRRRPGAGSGGCPFGPALVGAAGRRRLSSPAFGAGDRRRFFDPALLGVEAGRLVVGGPALATDRHAVVPGRAAAIGDDLAFDGARRALVEDLAVDRARLLARRNPATAVVGLGGPLTALVEVAIEVTARFGPFGVFAAVTAALVVVAAPLVPAVDRQLVPDHRGAFAGPAYPLVGVRGAAALVVLVRVVTPARGVGAAIRIVLRHPGPPAGGGRGGAILLGPANTRRLRPRRVRPLRFGPLRRGPLRSGSRRPGSLRLRARRLLRPPLTPPAGRALLVVAAADGFHTGVRPVPVRLQVAVIERLVDVVVRVVPVVTPCVCRVGRVEVGPQLGPVEVDLVEVVAGQVGLGRVDRHEVGVVEPARPLRVERGLRLGRLPAGAAGGAALTACGQLVDRAAGAAAAAGRNHRIRDVASLVLALLHDRRVGDDGILRVLLFPVFVVLEAHTVVPGACVRRQGRCRSPHRRMPRPPIVTRARMVGFHAVDVEG
ncbi:hypothetical protein C8E87_6526 [Paractinoplanes brasiliensis]|uniref:Uncharacterized protein n=1 Tax=Paractinoplanes brasiliensis TaxID=52695 RepID=A0A4R6J9K7_9ACTN|nr:hypothetical protein C8E87_6526 [Actinoplanes brasiliensis]